MNEETRTLHCSFITWGKHTVRWSINLGQILNKCKRNSLFPHSTLCSGLLFLATCFSPSKKIYSSMKGGKNNLSICRKKPWFYFMSQFFSLDEQSTEQIELSDVERRNTRGGKFCSWIRSGFYDPFTANGCSIRSTQHRPRKRTHESESEISVGIVCFLGKKSVINVRVPSANLRY